MSRKKVRFEDLLRIAKQAYAELLRVAVQDVDLVLCNSNEETHEFLCRKKGEDIWTRGVLLYWLKTPSLKSGVIFLENGMTHTMCPFTKEPKRPLLPPPKHW
jgi:hypothetical protein